MFGIGIPELIIIVLAFALLFFGSKKILDFSRSVGRVTGEFKKGKAEIEKEIQKGTDEGTQDSSKTQDNKEG